VADDDALRERLRRKAEETGRAAEADGDVPPDALDSLSRLARLVEIRERATPPVPPARWPVATLLAGALLLVSLLLFLRVSETDVELELTLSEVGFVLSGEQAITNVVRLAELRAAGLHGVQFTDPALSESLGAEVSEGRTVRLTAASRDGRTGSVTMSPITLPAGTEVRIQGTGADSQRLSLRGGATSLRATLLDPIDVNLPDTPTRSLDLRTPKAMLLETGANGVDLDLRDAEGSTVELAPQLAIDGLTLFGVDEFAPEGTTPQPVSAILSGTLYFESLNGAAHQLRPRELLRFGEIRGVIRTLQFDGDRITLNVRARTRGLRSGWSEDPASLMPTYLEWLQARHGLTLLWGTTLYLFGLMTVVLRWWRARA
jgi:hypothetical protein